MSSVFNDSLPSIAYIKGKNLKAHLGMSSFKSATASQRFSSSWDTDEVAGSANFFKLKDGFTCTSENIVNTVFCKRCKIGYVGRTYRRFGDSVVDYKQSVIYGKDCPVSEHFQGQTTVSTI